MSSRNPTSWMWAQACELMDQADRMHRQFFRLAVSQQTQALWEPPVDVFEDEHEILIVVALPGVAADSVEATLEAGMLIVRAQRQMPFANCPGVVRRLEVPYGRFERRIALSDKPLAAATREFKDGCLILRLTKAGRV